MSTVKITDSSFEDEVLKSDTPVLVDFWAEWCGPCKAIAPALEELSTEMDGKVKIAKLDIDANPDTASKFRVMSIPTMILFKDGAPAAMKVGASPKAELSKWLSAEL